MATTTTEKSETKPDKAEQRATSEAATGRPARSAIPAREKAIDLAVSTIEKQFGKGSIMRLGDGMAPPEVQVVPTGSLGLDIALGVGGLPRGRIVEIYGPESSGKTTLALHVVAEAQKRGGICAFIDAEHALDVGYARKLGVQHRRPAGVAAGLRRAGAGDRRHAGALGRGRRHRRRLGRGADAARPSSRARWATRTSACRRAS